MVDACSWQHRKLDVAWTQHNMIFVVVVFASLSLNKCCHFFTFFFVIASYIGNMSQHQQNAAVWFVPLNAAASAAATGPSGCCLLVADFLEAVSSAVGRFWGPWQDLCRLWRGTSPFVVWTPLNIFSWNNNRAICSFLLAHCSLFACLFSSTSSLQKSWVSVNCNWIDVIALILYLY